VFYIKITQATGKDIPEIVELWKQLADHHSEIDSFFTRRKNGHSNFEAFIKGLINSVDAKIFVAFNDDKIIGYTIAKIDLYPPVYFLEKHGSIYDMFVTLEYRRMGIARSLWQKALKWFKSLDLERVELSIVPTNTESSSFWKKQGFRDYMHRLYIQI
jgi:ribosomal protein S18 acetylase RimI-like enzyme